MKSSAKAVLRGVLPSTRPDHPAHTLLQQLRAAAFTRDGRPGYYSQNGQDRFVEQLLDGMMGGVFLDIGAFDGVHFSNTYYFEQNLGWSGLCVEPHPGVFEDLQANRSCRCVQAAVATQEGTALFLEVSGKGAMLSGLVDSHAHTEHAEAYAEEKGSQTQEIEVPCCTVPALVERYGMEQVDYLSIDTEGGEFDILVSVELEALGIQVISVEDNYPDGRIDWYLHENGYALKGILGDDKVFQRR